MTMIKTRLAASTTIFIFALTLFTGLQISAVPSAYADTAAPVILVLDVQETLQNSEAGKHIKKQLDEKQSVYIKEIQAKEEELKKTEQELIRQRTVLSPEAFQEKKKDFDNKMMALNQRFQEQRQVLDKSFGEAKNTLMKGIFEIVEDVKKKRNANVVLHAQQVIVSDSSMDITPEVLKTLNQKIPTYKITFSS